MDTYVIFSGLTLVVLGILSAHSAWKDHDGGLAVGSLVMFLLGGWGLSTL